MGVFQIDYVGGIFIFIEKLLYGELQVLAANYVHS